MIRRNGLPEPTLQHVFHPVRMWRFDFAWLQQKVAIEVQGFGEGHNSFEGMKNDYEKHNAALVLGWRTIFLMAPDLELIQASQTANLIATVLGVPLNGNNEIDDWSIQLDRARRKLAENQNS